MGQQASWMQVLYSLLLPAQKKGNGWPLHPVRTWAALVEFSEKSTYLQHKSGQKTSNFMSAVATLSLLLL